MTFAKYAAAFEQTAQTFPTYGVGGEAPCDPCRGARCNPHTRVDVQVRHTAEDDQQASQVSCSAYLPERQFRQDEPTWSDRSSTPGFTQPASVPTRSRIVEA
jgi:hypothetical protein